MKKLAFIFPGQGSQSVGMCKEFYEENSVAKAAIDEASDTLGFDMAALIINGPAEVLNQTSYTQPALLAASVAVLRALKAETAITAALLAGHSLGEYTALVAAGVINYPDALRIVRLRGELMQEAVPPGEGAMSAVIGMDDDDVVSVCEEATTGPSDVVVAANLNSPGQVVISGSAGAVLRAGELAKERGARKVIVLQVSVPSHSPLMMGAAEKLATSLLEIELGAFSVPVVTNVEGTPSSDPTKTVELLKRQLFSPVRWVDSVRALASGGIEAVVEIGPGKVLTSLVRRIDKSIKTHNISEPADISKFLDSLK